MTDYPLYPETGSHHDATPPAPSVEEARTVLMESVRWLDGDPDEIADALIAAVRRDTLREVREKVKGCRAQQVVFDILDQMEAK